MIKLTRRNVMQSAVAGTLAVGAGSFFWSSQSFANHGAIPSSRLKIPPKLEGREEQGVQVYDLTLQNGKTVFVEGYQTQTSGINGTYLGPTLVMRNGSAVRINVTNQLGEASTLHWHGMHLPASQDGGPHQLIANKGVWSPEFTIKQQAASLWYHSHLMGQTGAQVWRGLAGMLIIEDDEIQRLNLPHEYGVDDIPLVLQDRSFTQNGQLDYGLSMHSKMMGKSGNLPLTNGTLVAYFEAKTTRLRLRLLNGSNASTYHLALDNGQSFEQIATDGGLLEAPVKLSMVRLAPGERAEIVVDLSAGQPITLQNITQTSASMMDENNNAPNFNFLEIRPHQTLTQIQATPEQLNRIEWLQETDAVKTRSFNLQMTMGMGAMMGGTNSHTINDKAMDMGRIDEVVKRGTTEIWQLSNTSMMPHPFHMHDVQFQILDRNGRKPPANEQGRKDVVLVDPGEVVRIIMRFEDYAEDAPFMYHCHILEHEDAGMMGQFLVVS
jgi:FtsP/CotA-like multicopper oxidase with cupredoxin domain